MCILKLLTLKFLFGCFSIDRSRQELPETRKVVY